AVFPGYLFSLLIGAAVIRDRHLVKTAAAFGKLHRNLGFETKAVRFQVDAVENLGAKDFVTHLHVGEVEVRQHVGNQREQPVAQRSQKKRYGMAAAPGEWLTIDHTRQPDLDGLQ